MRLLRALAATALVLFVLLAALDVALAAWFPRFDRLAENFSSAYLEREVDALAKEPPRSTIVAIGDSVLWGYKLRSNESVIAQLRRSGLAARNLSFEGGSPANTYALLRLMFARGVRPRVVVFNVNQKEFSSSDSAYQKIHPSLDALAGGLLTSDERALLLPTVDRGAIEARLDGWISAHWKFYALRPDIREALYGQVDAAHALDDVVQSASGAKLRIEAAHRPTPDRFEGTYDLSPLDDHNVSVVFLRKIAALLKREGVPAIALLTPTNHVLLHEFIDVPQYGKNLTYVRVLLERDGVRVVDLDRTFAGAEFIDNDHLTAAGNQHLAEILEPELAR
jgi:lysophospholipase L1-like esterase